MDPQIVFAYLGSKVTLHPVVQASFYDAPILHSLFKSMGAIPINNGVTENITHDEISNTLKDVKQALRAKKNIVIYPAG